MRIMNTYDENKTSENLQRYNIIVHMLRGKAIIYRLPWKVGVVGESLTRWHGWIRGYHHEDYGSVWYFGQGPEYFGPGNPVFYFGA
jgi:hypothetical protein